LFGCGRVQLKSRDIKLKFLRVYNENTLGNFPYMNVVIETERLYLRTFTMDDAGLVYELNADPDVTRFTHDLMASLEQAREVLEKNILPQYALYNHGRWAVHLKNDMSFIGWCGLKYRPELNEIDLGYRFAKAFWGYGYATEAAFASIKYGFEKLNLPRIVGRAEPQNTGSVKVLQKCGMQYMGLEKVDDYPVETYVILNPSTL
jgi:[ribosomal protein S5]-alanine N-acetyltransferase